MDKFVDNVKPPQTEINILLPTEKIFSIKLMEILGKDYKIIKSRNMYAPIDFIIINKQNLKSVYVEYKRRTNDQNNYKSIIVNESRIISCKKYYPNTLFVFEYNKEINSIKYDEESFNTYDRNKVKSQDVVFIPTQFITKSNIEDLCKNIKKYLK